MEKEKVKKNLTVTEFFKKFPDDDSCLDHLMNIRFGKSGQCQKCGKQTNYSRVRKIPAYQCQWCGNHVHPMVGTPFAKSRTPLQKWFFAMYLFTTSRHGVAAKELQRQLGVTYKCAWRIGHEIRKYMTDTDGDGSYRGHVEVDETFIGGRKKMSEKMQNKAVVFGMVERGGKVQTYVVPDRKKCSLAPHIERIEKGSTISTDEFRTYRYLGKAGYNHGKVCHEYGEYVKGIHHTNTIEGFWSRLKNSIRGTHIHVSKKHLSKYLGEFEYRYNMRANPSLMFDRLLASF
jgi:transposase-like protein